MLQQIMPKSIEMLLLDCNDITTTNSQCIYNPGGSKSSKEKFIKQEKNYRFASIKKNE